MDAVAGPPAQRGRAGRVGGHQHQVGERDRLLQVVGPDRQEPLAGLVPVAAQHHLVGDVRRRAAPPRAVVAADQGHPARHHHRADIDAGLDEHLRAAGRYRALDPALHGRARHRLEVHAAAEGVVAAGGDQDGVGQDPVDAVAVGVLVGGIRLVGADRGLALAPAAGAHAGADAGAGAVRGLDDARLAAGVAVEAAVAGAALRHALLRAAVHLAAGVAGRAADRAAVARAGAVALGVEQAEIGADLSARGRHLAGGAERPVGHADRRRDVRLLDADHADARPAFRALVVPAAGDAAHRAAGQIETGAARAVAVVRAAIAGRAGRAAVG
jgi:hypothetical protein